MKKELEAAIVLDPKLADAYSLLAYAQAFSGEPEKGLATMQKAVELSPRNESYQINLANIYMTNHKVDEAIALLRSLVNSETPGVANQASAGLAQAEDFKERSKSFQMRIVNRSPQEVEAAGNSGSGSVSAGKVEAKIEMEEAPLPVRFIKGKLATVDCSAAPQALLSVVSGGRSFKLHIDDSKHVVLLGADNFSCDWRKRAWHSTIASVRTATVMLYRSKSSKSGSVTA
jgi:tetratricopeptide (TPR) repeat protein